VFIKEWDSHYYNVFEDSHCGKRNNANSLTSAWGIPLWEIRAVSLTLAEIYNFAFSE